MKTSKILLLLALLALIPLTSFAKDIDKSADNHQRISKKFIHVVHEQWGVAEDKISCESSLLKDFGADSLDFIELIMAVEENFDIEIYDAEGDALTTVNSAVELIVDKKDSRY
jgi:acyl carrier protein